MTHVEAENNFMGNFSPFTIWNPGIELKSSGLVTLITGLSHWLFFITLNKSCFIHLLTGNHTQGLTQARGVRFY